MRRMSPESKTFLHSRPARRPALRKTAGTHAGRSGVLRSPSQRTCNASGQIRQNHGNNQQAAGDGELLFGANDGEVHAGSQDAQEEQRDDGSEDGATAAEDASAA